jgi:hypothetical protein
VSATVAAVVTDLMDRSRIDAAVSGRVDYVRTPDELSGSEASVVFADLRAVPDPAVLRRLVPSARIVAFGSHVDDDVLDAARAAGIDEVLPRSSFFRRLPELAG